MGAFATLVVAILAVIVLPRLVHRVSQAIPHALTPIALHPPGKSERSSPTPTVLVPFCICTRSVFPHAPRRPAQRLLFRVNLVQPPVRAQLRRFPQTFSRNMSGLATRAPLCALEGLTNDRLRLLAHVLQLIRMAHFSRNGSRATQTEAPIRKRSSPTTVPAHRGHQEVSM